MVDRAVIDPAAHGLRPLSQVLSDLAPRIQRHALRSDLTLAGLTLWHDLFPQYVKDVGGVPCLFTIYMNRWLALYGPPLCEFDDPLGSRAFDLAMRFIEDASGHAGFALRLPTPWLDRLGDEHFAALHMYPEYVYDRRTLASLDGPRLSRRRAEVRRFCRRAPFSIVPLSRDLRPEVDWLLDAWLEERNARPGHDVPDAIEFPVLGAIPTPSTRQLLELERRGLRRVLDRLGDETFQLLGGAVRVGDRLAGVSLATPVGGAVPREAAVLAEKTTRAVPGTSAFIFSWAAREPLEGFDVINAGDAENEPGIAANKASFSPIGTRDSWAVVRRPHRT